MLSPYFRGGEEENVNGLAGWWCDTHPVKSSISFDRDALSATHRRRFPARYPFAFFFDHGVRLFPALKVVDIPSYSGLI